VSPFLAERIIHYGPTPRWSLGRVNISKSSANSGSFVSQKAYTVVQSAGNNKINF
jgi:hypothetical protein